MHFFDITCSRFRIMKKDIQILSAKEIKQGDVELERGNVSSYPIHGHTYYEILIYEAFDGEISVNGVRYTTDTPTAVLVTPSDFHGIGVKNDNGAHFYKWKISREIMDRFSDRSFSSTITKDREQICFLSMLSDRGYNNSSDHPYLSATAALVALSVQKSAEMIPCKNKSTALIKKATDIINQGFREPITLTSVAQELHVSPHYLSNLFKDYAGINFVEYLTERRLHYAKALLQNGSNSTEACFDSGYRNLSHFIRSFKKRFGITPSQCAKIK